MGGFGIGSPVAVIAMEELIAYGVKEFISIGTAGSLQQDVNIGDIVLCERAIRDEGSSHHYLPLGKYSYPDESFTRKFGSSLKANAVNFRLGTSWTIDSPYRETVAEAKHYQAEGVITVEMEASALFAVAAYRKIPIASAFTISDSLADLKWRPEFHSEQTQSGLEKLYQSAIF
jgi:uridine phosphorylase